jgi:hypothetical protein
MGFTLPGGKAPQALSSEHLLAAAVARLSGSVSVARLGAGSISCSRDTEYEMHCVDASLARVKDQVAQRGIGWLPWWRRMRSDRHTHSLFERPTEQIEPEPARCVGFGDDRSPGEERAF